MPENISRPRILIVDDDAKVQASLEELLSPRFKLFMAANAAEAQEQLKKRRLAAILLDLMLPDAKGEDLLAELVRKNPFVPVIVVTGIKEAATGLACFKAGAFDYVVKPYNADELIQIMIKAAEYNRLKRQADIFEKWSKQAKHKKTPSGRASKDFREWAEFMARAYWPGKTPKGTEFDALMQEAERQALIRCLSLNNWNQTHTAAWLGLHVNTVAEKMRRLGIHSRERGRPS